MADDDINVNTIATEPHSIKSDFTTAVDLHK